MRCRDDDGKLTGAGDRITFSYGIPPRKVEGRVMETLGVLWVQAIGYTGAVRLRSLRRHVGAWWKKEDA